MACLMQVHLVGEERIQLAVVKAQEPVVEHQRLQPSTSDFAADAAGTCKCSVMLGFCMIQQDGDHVSSLQVR